MEESLLPSLETRKQNKMLLLLTPDLLSPEMYFRCHKCHSYIRCSEHVICQEYFLSTHVSYHPSMITKGFYDCILCSHKNFMHKSLTSYYCAYLRSAESCSPFQYRDSSFHVAILRLSQIYTPNIFLLNINGKPYQNYPPDYWQDSEKYHPRRFVCIEIYDENNALIHSFDIFVAESQLW